MTAFCTAVDSAYLARALILYRSLERHASPFHLHVLCVDETALQTLEALRLPSATAIPIGELEDADPELARVRPSRSTPEYCWTAKPPLCRYLLDREPELEAVTYVDSDLFFFDDPRVLLVEMAGKAVMLVPHRFPPERERWAKADGVYNAGWLTFANDPRAYDALDWWRARCIEWCYDRREDGRYTDQKYLEEMERRFDGVHVMQHPGGGLAPWNAGQHTLARSDVGPLVDGQRVVFYHYQSLTLFPVTPVHRLYGWMSGWLHREEEPFRALWRVGDYYGTSDDELELLWRPYVREVLDAVVTLRSIDPTLAMPWGALDRDDWSRAFAKLRGRR